MRTEPQLPRTGTSSAGGCSGHGHHPGEGRAPHLTSGAAAHAAVTTDPALPTRRPTSAAPRPTSALAAPAAALLLLPRETVPGADKDPSLREGRACLSRAGHGGAQEACPARGTWCPRRGGACQVPTDGVLSGSVPGPQPPVYLLSKFISLYVRFA